MDLEVLRKRDSWETRATYTGRQDAQNILGVKLTSRVYDCFFVAVVVDDVVVVTTAPVVDVVVVVARGDDVVVFVAIVAATVH